MTNIIQNGGFKLDEKYKNENGFESIMNMLKDKKSNFKILTMSGLSGFVFTLDNVSNPRFLDIKYNFDDSNNKIGNLEKPVKNYIIKMTIIYDNLIDVNNIYKNIYIGEQLKKTETSNDIINEGFLQRYIWRELLINGFEEISPPVANNTIFYNYYAKELLNNIIKYSNMDDVTKVHLEYLLTILNHNSEYKLSFLTMKNYKNSMSLKNFLSGNNDKNQVKKILKCIIKKIIRLFLFGFIHFDLHYENILVYKNHNKEYECVIIDFGRISKYNDYTNDKYLCMDTKIKLNNMYKLFEQRKTSVYDILNYINTLDRNYASLFDNNRDSQMSYWLSIPFKGSIQEYNKKKYKIPDNSDIIKEILNDDNLYSDILKMDFNPEKIQRDIYESYDGNVIYIHDKNVFENKNDDYMEVEENNFGGKSNKKNKTKKNKNNGMKKTRVNSKIKKQKSRRVKK